jgi:glucosamine 6-phosphate synthetase-like amidotransferase/phosphosugar isomerase protein
MRPLAHLPACGCNGIREHKIAAVMSCGKDFAVLQTAGSPSTDGWHTPDAPKNIIQIQLATGSVVEQMNAHPFAKLHTALTHNGETNNYESLKQRVEQFNLSPLATTDTEVASLKFHLTSDAWKHDEIRQKTNYLYLLACLLWDWRTESH